MQEFRPLERSLVVKRESLLRHWKEYALELRHASISLPPKEHLLILLQEHPTIPWRLPDSLAQESGYSVSMVCSSLIKLVAEGKVVAHTAINGKTYYATKERADMQPGWAGEVISDPDNDFNFNYTKPEVKSATDMFSELEKSLQNACLKVKEAAKINEQLFNLERDVTSSENTTIR